MFGGSRNYGGTRVSTAGAARVRRNVARASSARAGRISGS